MITIWWAFNVFCKIVFWVTTACGQVPMPQECHDRIKIFKRLVWIVYTRLRNRINIGNTTINRFLRDLRHCSGGSACTCNTGGLLWVIFFFFIIRRLVQWRNTRQSKSLHGRKRPSQYLCARRFIPGQCYRVFFSAFAHDCTTAERATVRSQWYQKPTL